jgi:transcriptional regulator with XRE-family HTH domain
MAKAMTKGALRAALAVRLRALRTARAMSQDQLGRASDLSGKFIGEVERSQKSISIDSLYRISRALEVPLAALTKVEAESPQDRMVSKQLEQLVALARQHPKQLSRLLAVVHELLS